MRRERVKVSESRTLARDRGIRARDLAAFSVREVNRAAAKERDEYSSAEGQ